VDLLETPLRYAALTGGAFDPTVRPLRELYANHFAKEDADPSGPDSASMKTALACADYHRVSVDRDRFVARKRTAITLNGIAQGQLLRSRVIAHTPR
jgi:thiamine biosynthesis lipoprotein